jgi:hypothetical protein
MTDQEWKLWFEQLVDVAETAVDRLVRSPRGGDEERQALDAVRAAQADIRCALNTSSDEELATRGRPGAG